MKLKLGSIAYWLMKYSMCEETAGKAGCKIPLKRKAFATQMSDPFSTPNQDTKIEMECEKAIFVKNLSLELLSWYSWVVFVLPTGARSDQQRTDSQGDTLWSAGGRVLPQRNPTERRKQEVLLAGKSVACKLWDFS